jgi:xylose isomerase
VVEYEGCYSTNPFAYKFYNADQIVAGKSMRQHLRFALCYGKAVCADGADAFGQAVADRSFGAATQAGCARDRACAAMELMHKLGLSYYAFADRDLAPEADTLRESNARLDEIGEYLISLQQVYAVRPLRVSADLTAHPRYRGGAATACGADVFVFAAAQVKKALELAARMGAASFQIDGGREGTGFLPVCNDALERENLARFLRLTAEHAQKIGFDGELCVRPGPPGAALHPYWTDGAEALAFLRQYQLDGTYRINLPGGAADLTGLRMVGEAGRLHTIDAAAQGSGAADEAAMTVLELLRLGGFQTGGFLLDTAPRRVSSTPEDIFLTYIMLMDTYALGLLLAQRILFDGRLEQFRRDRYASFGYGVGKAITEGRMTMEQLELYALEKGEPAVASGRQEYLDNMLRALMMKGI